MKQFYSSISNIFYLISGILIGTLSNDILTLMVALSSGILAAGSFLYHATLHKIAQRLDEWAMYVVSMALISLGLVLTFNWPAQVGLGIWLVASAVFGWQVTKVDSFQTIPLLSTIILILVFLNSSVFHTTCLLLLAAASYAARQYGKAKFGHGTKEEIMHSIWHFGTAASIYYAYLLLTGIL